MPNCFVPFLKYFYCSFCNLTNYSALPLFSLFIPSFLILHILCHYYQPFSSIPSFFYVKCNVNLSLSPPHNIIRFVPFYTSFIFLHFLTFFFYLVLSYLPSFTAFILLHFHTLLPAYFLYNSSFTLTTLCNGSSYFFTIHLVHFSSLLLLTLFPASPF